MMAMGSSILNFEFINFELSKYSCKRMFDMYPKSTSSVIKRSVSWRISSSGRMRSRVLIIFRPVLAKALMKSSS